MVGAGRCRLRRRRATSEWPAAVAWPGGDFWYARAVNESALHNRLVEAIGHLAIRHVGDKTGVNPEHVNRYLRGHPPTAEFVAAVCAAFDISADWLLMGRGPMRATDARRQALRETGAPELLSALSLSVQRLVERVERAESVQQAVLPVEGRASRLLGPAAHEQHAP
jgi:transcriptional regulator with XRE-family HTH domain